MDVFIESELDPAELGQSLERCAAGTALELKSISNRGTMVYPRASRMSADCIDHWPCRFMLRDESAELTDLDVLTLLDRVSVGHRWMHLERLPEFDGELGFTKAQGED